MNAMTKACLYLFYFFLLLKPVACQVDFDKDVTTLPSGLILEKTDSVIVSSGQTSFPLLLRTTFPSLNIEKSSKCPLKESSRKLWEQVHESIVTEIADQMHMVIAGNFSRAELQHFVENLLQNNKQEMGLDKRSRRSFQYLRDGYFLESSWTEDKFSKMTDWSEGHFAAINKRINENGVSINLTLAALDEVEQSICQDQEENWQSALESLRLSFILSIQNFLTITQQAKNGFLPGSVPDEFLEDFCLAHFRPNPESDFCSNVNLRKLFSVRLIAVIEGQGIPLTMGLKMQVFIPLTDTKPHKVYQMKYMPIFHPKSNTTAVTSSRTSIGRSLLRSSIQYIAVQTTPLTRNFEALAGYEHSGCVNHDNFLVCSNRARFSEESCLQDILFNDRVNHDCVIETKFSSLDCIAHRMTNGVIVSSLNEVTIHSHNVRDSRDQIFNLRDIEKKGLFFISKHRSVMHIFSCGQRQIKVQPDPEMKMIVIDRSSSNISLSYEANTSNLHSSIQAIRKQEIKKEKIDAQINSANTKDLDNFWISHFGVPVHKSLKSSGLNLISFLFLSFSVFLIYKLVTRCCLKRAATRHISSV